MPCCAHRHPGGRHPLQPEPRQSLILSSGFNREEERWGLAAMGTGQWDSRFPLRVLPGGWGLCLSPHPPAPCPRGQPRGSLLCCAEDKPSRGDPRPGSGPRAEPRVVVALGSHPALQ